MRRNDDQNSAQVGVTCEVYREALSAAMDGERPPVETAIHLAGCDSCAEWARVVPDLQRPLRMQSVDVVPDLAERILTAIVGSAPRPSLGLSLARAALMAIAIVQAVAGVVHLVTRDGSGAHAAAELGAWSFALGIAFATAALRPRSAYAVLPMVAGMVAFLGFASVRDLIAGDVSVQRVLEHTTIVGGLVLVTMLAWLMRHRRPRSCTDRPFAGTRVRGLLTR